MAGYELRVEELRRLFSSIMQVSLPDYPDGDENRLRCWVTERADGMLTLTVDTGHGTQHMVAGWDGSAAEAEEVVRASAEAMAEELLDARGLASAPGERNVWQFADDVDPVESARQPHRRRA